MKLSEIKGTRSMDVIADIIDPIANIAEDPDAAEMFKRVKLPDGADPRRFLVKRARNVVPFLLKAHKTDLLTILATVNGVSVAEYGESMTLSSLIADSVDILMDEAFVDFFVQTGDTSGDASATTEGHSA